MPHSEQMREYLAFLLWFKNQYPDLNKKYWRNITIPKADEGVSFIGTGIPADVFDHLVEILYDYYNSTT